MTVTAAILAAATVTVAILAAVTVTMAILAAVTVTAAILAAVAVTVAILAAVAVTAAMMMAAIVTSVGITAAVVRSWCCRPCPFSTTGAKGHGAIQVIAALTLPDGAVATIYAAPGSRLRTVQGNCRRTRRTRLAAKALGDGMGL